MKKLETPTVETAGELLNYEDTQLIASSIKKSLIRKKENINNCILLDNQEDTLYTMLIQIKTSDDLIIYHLFEEYGHVWYDLETDHVVTDKQKIDLLNMLR